VGITPWLCAVGPGRAWALPDGVWVLLIEG